MAVTAQAGTRLPAFDGGRLRTVVAFWSMVATAGAATVIAVLFAVAIVQIGIAGSKANLDGWAEILNAAATVMGICSWVAFVASLVWLYRAVANLAVLDYPGSISPAMSVVWWFVPIAFFFMPYRVVRSLYAYSAPEHHLLGGRVVEAWWACWWISWALFAVNWFLTPAVTDVPGALLLAFLALLYSVALAAAAGLGALLLRAVSRGQRELAMRLG
jgi:hypothetical protein